MHSDVTMIDRKMSSDSEATKTSMSVSLNSNLLLWRADPLAYKPYTQLKWVFTIGYFILNTLSAAVRPEVHHDPRTPDWEPMA